LFNTHGSNWLIFLIFFFQDDEWVKNLNNAFSTAENQLGIMSLLDAPDVAVDKPDERSIMTYVAALYHYFSSMENDDVATQRVANIVQELAEIQQLQEDYEMKGFFFFEKEKG